MRSRSFLVTLVLAALFLSHPSAAHAHYDDVHYALNYYVARVIGYTPLQAYRLASLCVMVDYSPETEPTQLENAVAQLMANKGVAAPILGPRVAKLYLALSNLMQKRAIDQINQLPDDVELLVKDPAFAETFVAQWRFHAFRDVVRWPNAAVPGADAVMADADIVRQHNLLLGQAQDLRNPGVFLHFYQDEIPHAEYIIGGGHWVLPTGRREIGSTTDWLSNYAEDRNLEMVAGTIRAMWQFMETNSHGHQKPLVSSQIFCLERCKAAVRALRAVNDSPLGLKDMVEVIQAKWLMAKHNKGERGTDEQEGRFAKHADGPNLNAAMQELARLMAGNGMTELRIPPKPIEMKILKDTATSGAVVPGRDESVLYGDIDLNVTVPGAKPSRIDAVVRSVPTQRGESSVELARGLTRDPSSNTPIQISDVPVGDVDVEVQFIDNAGIIKERVTKRVRIDKAKNTVDIASKPLGSRFVLSRILLDPKKRTGRAQSYDQLGHTFVETITATSYQYDCAFEDWHLKYSWTMPPRDLRPGETFSVTVTWSNTLKGKAVKDMRKFLVGAAGVTYAPPSIASPMTYTFHVPTDNPPRDNVGIYIQPDLCTFEYIWDKTGTAQPAVAPVAAPAPNAPASPGQADAALAPGGGPDGATPPSGADISPAGAYVSPGVASLRRLLSALGPVSAAPPVAASGSGSPQAAVPRVAAAHPLGVRLQIQDFELVIQTVNRGSRADQAGIRAGDRIIEINGRPIKEIGVKAAVLFMASDAGKSVTAIRNGMRVTLAISAVRTDRK